MEEFDGGLARRMTDRALLDGLRELSRRQGATLFVTLMAGLQALLHRYTGQSDITVGTVSANRTRPELAGLIGFLVATLPIRGDLSGDPPFTDLLARLRDATVAAYAHQDLPFGKLVEALRVERDPGRSPLFQVLLSLRRARGGPGHGGRGRVRASPTWWRASTWPSSTSTSWPRRARTGCGSSARTRPGCSTPATVERLLGHLEVLLRGAVADPSARLSELPLLTEAERHAELVTLERHRRPGPGGLRARGLRGPGRPAPRTAWPPSTRAAELSYADLNRHASQIAPPAARARAWGPRCWWASACRPGSTRLAALLGIWKAGGGYVPLDPALPPDRLAFMITDAALPLILTDTASLTSLPATEPRHGLLILRPSGSGSPRSTTATSTTTAPAPATWLT